MLDHRTVALNGLPINLSDFEGVPPLPLDVDDDYLTPHAHLPQPAHRTSSMTGFIAVTRIWQIVARCQLRQKIYTLQSSSFEGESAVEVDGLLDWLVESLVKVRKVVDDLPKELKRDFGELQFERDGAEKVAFGIQQANIYVTALVAEFVFVCSPVLLQDFAFQE